MKAWMVVLMMKMMWLILMKIRLFEDLHIGILHAEFKFYTDIHWILALL